MTKHLYFNPKNFEELVLSGVLIELFKDDIEVHAHEEGEKLRFVQGHNVVEESIENILRFANTITKHKIFGRNWQQQAVINMINSVCKDIEKKLSEAQSSTQLMAKIDDMNRYWFDKSNQWVKKRFLFCHMRLLSLSFQIQEKYPQILAKNQCFVQLRRLFIEQKLISKRSLVAMFTHPDNKYQEFDLFPQLESSIHENKVPIQQSGDQQIERGQTLEQQIEEAHQAMTASHQQAQTKEQNDATIHQQKSETVTVHTDQNQESSIAIKQQQTHNHNDQISQHKHTDDQSKISAHNEEKDSNILHSQENETKRVDPQNVFISEIQKQQSTIVNLVSSEIHQIQDNFIAQSKTSNTPDHSQQNQQNEVVSPSVPTTQIRKQQSAVMVKIPSKFSTEYPNEPVIIANISQNQHQKEKQVSHHHEEKQIQQKQTNINSTENLIKKTLQHEVKKQIQYSEHPQADHKQQVPVIQKKHQQQVHHQQNHHHQEAPLMAVTHTDAENKKEQTVGHVETKHEVTVNDSQKKEHVGQDVSKSLKEQEKKINQNHEPLQQKQQIKQNVSTNVHQQAPQAEKVENHSPESYSFANSQKGPTASMDKKIKPKEQSAAVHKETCKCEIF